MSEIDSALAKIYLKFGLKPINAQSNTHAINGVAIDINCLGKTLSIDISE